MENLGNDFTTTLAAAITDTIGTTITVASSTGAPAANFRILIDTEWMLVTAIAHPNWTVQRGIEGSTAATHLNGATVAHTITKGGLDTYAEENFTVQIPTVESGRTKTVASGRQWIAGGSVKVDGTLVLGGDLFVV